MKKLMLTVAGLLLVSVMAVNAQVEESTDMTQDTTQQETPGVTDEQSNYARDMETVEPSEVPEGLRSTLEGTEYAGWEQGKVYRNTATNEFIVVIGDEDAQVYRFDSNGARIEGLEESDNSQPQAPAPTEQPAPEPAPEPSPSPSEQPDGN